MQIVASKKVLVSTPANLSPRATASDALSQSVQSASVSWKISAKSGLRSGMLDLTDA